MASTSAKEIICSLSNGIDYETGEVLPSDSILNRAEVVRALYACLDGLELMEKRQRIISKLPVNASKKWGVEEEAQLTAEFQSGMNVKDIAAKHGRTVGSISARLVRLGLIKERSDISALD